MSPHNIKRLWGMIVGAIAGWMFGQLNVIWAAHVPTVYHMREIGGVWVERASFTLSMMENRNVVLMFGVLFGAALGFGIVHSLTNIRHTVCSSCKQENLLLANQFCGEEFDRIAESSLVCPSCDKRYPNGAKFCPMCAVELKLYEVPRQDVITEDPTKGCPACGATNLSRRSACHKCGKPI